MKEYIIEQRKGFGGIGDFEMEWLTPEEQEIRWAQNRKRIEGLKKSGEKYTFKISIEECKILDKASDSITSASFSHVIWDVNKNR